MKSRSFIFSNSCASSVRRTVHLHQSTCAEKKHETVSCESFWFDVSVFVLARFLISCLVCFSCVWWSDRHDDVAPLFSASQAWSNPTAPLCPYSRQDSVCSSPCHLPTATATFAANRIIFSLVGHISQSMPQCFNIPDSFFVSRGEPAYTTRAHAAQGVPAATVLGSQDQLGL